MATDWSKILLIFGCGVLAAAQLGTIAPIAPALQGDLGMSRTMLGAATSAITLVGALFGGLAGVMTGRVGYWRALWLGLLIMAVAAGIGALTGESRSFLAVRILAGIGYLAVVTAAPSLLAFRAAPADRPLVLALWGTFVPVGIALADAASASLLAPFGWRGLFASDAALLALAAVLIALRTGGTPDVEPRTLSPWQVFCRRSPLMLSLGFFSFALSFLAVASLLPSFLIEARGVAVGEAGRSVAAVSASAVFGSLAAGWMMRRRASPRLLAAIGLALPAAATSLIFSTTAPLPLLMAASGVAFAVGGLTPAAVFAAVPTLATGQREIGAVNGLVAQCGSLGSLAGPPLLALWTEMAGWAMAPLPLLAVALAGAACLWASASAPRSPAP